MEPIVRVTASTADGVATVAAIGIATDAGPTTFAVLRRRGIVLDGRASSIADDAAPAPPRRARVPRLRRRVARVPRVPRRRRVAFRRRHHVARARVAADVPPPLAHCPPRLRPSGGTLDPADGRHRGLRRHLGAGGGPPREAPAFGNDVGASSSYFKSSLAHGAFEGGEGRPRCRLRRIRRLAARARVAGSAREARASRRRDDVGAPSAAAVPSPIAHGTSAGRPRGLRWRRRRQRIRRVSCGATGRAAPSSAPQLGGVGAAGGGGDQGGRASDGAGGAVVRPRPVRIREHATLDGRAVEEVVEAPRRLHVHARLNPKLLAHLLVALAAAGETAIALVVLTVAVHRHRRRHRRRRFVRVAEPVVRGGCYRGLPSGPAAARRFA